MANEIIIDVHGPSVTVSAHQTTPLSYRVKTAAEATGLSTSTIERAIARGELHSVKVGRATIILASALEGWLANLAAQS